MIEHRPWVMMIRHRGRCSSCCNRSGSGDCLCHAAHQVASVSCFQTTLSFGGFFTSRVAARSCTRSAPPRINHHISWLVLNHYHSVNMSTFYSTPALRYPWHPFYNMLHHIIITSGPLGTSGPPTWGLPLPWAPPPVNFLKLWQLNRSEFLCWSAD